MKIKKIKTIISKGWTRSPQSEYVKDRCELIRMMQLLGIITDIRMRMDDTLDGKPRWALTLECEIKDED